MGYVEDKSNDVLRNDENDIIKQETDRLSDSGIDNKGDKKGKGNELSQPRFSFTHETEDQRNAREAIDEWIAREVQPIIDRNSESEANEPKFCQGDSQYYSKQEGLGRRRLTREQVTSLQKSRPTKCFVV